MLKVAMIGGFIQINKGSFNILIIIQSIKSSSVTWKREAGCQGKWSDIPFEQGREGGGGTSEF